MSEILVKPAELKQVSNDLRKNAADIQRSIDAVDAIIKALGPSRFEGARADALRSRYARIREQIYNFKPLVTKFANELDNAATRFSAADKV
jgi:WXG100 family type VII secretion target